MKNYTIFYEYYPFDVTNFKPKCEVISANTLEEAFSKLETSKGKENIEIFKEAAKKHYNIL